MTAEHPLCFIDTNVLVYAFERTDSAKKRIAQQLMSQAMAEDRLRLSTQVLQELFVTLTRKVKQPCSVAQALSVVEDLAVWPLMVVDFAAIRLAGQLSGQASLSFWDALIVVAAARSGASVLYTEDMNDGQDILGVRVSNPFAG